MLVGGVAYERRTYKAISDVQNTHINGMNLYKGEDMHAELGEEMSQSRRAWECFGTFCDDQGCLIW